MPRKLPRMQTPVQKAKVEEEQRKMTFSEKYEEELKRQLFEKTQSEVKEDVNDILNANTTIHKPHPDQEWDVPITEEIKYFDSELSYEITGYRPITMDKGLDFKSELFTIAADTYNKTGNYTQYPYGSKKYRTFWEEEFNRCINGYTVGKYHITGDNYFYLNYYRMDIIVESGEGGQGRSESFPKFLSKQYEWFHYVEMASKLHLDVCALKARGVN